jgi:hypothetical protein
MAGPITPRHRVQAIERLAEIEHELAEISTWLSLHDADKAAIVLECATRDVAAACWTLQPPLRTRPAGWLNGRT